MKYSLWTWHNVKCQGQNGEVTEQNRHGLYFLEAHSLPKPVLLNSAMISPTSSQGASANIFKRNVYQMLEACYHSIFLQQRLIYVAYLQDTQLGTLER